MRCVEEWMFERSRQKYRTKIGTASQLIHIQKWTKFQDQGYILDFNLW
jgi:hypothetical protein